MAFFLHTMLHGLSEFANYLYSTNNVSAGCAANNLVHPLATARIASSVESILSTG